MPDTRLPVLLCVLEDCLLGQYRGYKDDPTIENSETITPTYACMRCHVNTPTWQGVPFVLEAGKAMDERLCEIRMIFKNGEEDDGQSSKTATLPNALVLRLSPRPSVFLSTHLKHVKSIKICLLTPDRL